MPHTKLRMLAAAGALCLLAAAEPPAGPTRYMPLPGPPLEYLITETTTTEMPDLGPVEKVDHLGQTSVPRTARPEEIAEVGAGPVALVVDDSRRDSGSKDPEQRILTYLSSSAEGILIHAVRGPDGALERYAPPLRQLPRDLTAGAVWDLGSVRQQGLIFPTAGLIVGLERATTPAGAFDSCLHVRFTVNKVGGAAAADGASAKVKQGTALTDDWYAPGIGLVREVTTSTVTLDLGGRTSTISIRQVQELKKTPG